ncbi:hypothetical protein ACNKU7_18770, partial [Microbulbifer sp. SA54]|uniref:hypothetical protein n=1 Tax=Microbulbifer sp. SA54 TaxID=3401577 RepID=UPI003AADF0CB
GSRGGGAIKLVVNNSLEVYGKILANGAYSSSVGGGSGGSIWIEAGEIVGNESTQITSTGGSGYHAGSGGGGRIALYYDALSGFDPRQQVLAQGGAPLSGVNGHGGAGTVFLYDRSLASGNSVLQIVNRSSSAGYGTTYVAGQIESDIYVDQGRLIIGDGSHLGGSIIGTGSANAYVLAEGMFTVANDDLLVSGFTFEIGESLAVNTISIQDNGVISSRTASESFQKGITLSANSIHIENGSSIDVTGKGWLPSEHVSFRSGGSYGGLGGTLSNESTNEIYGSDIAPIDFGTGGRYTSDSSPGLRGGGAFKLTALKLELFGSLVADGNGDVSSNGGGSGGSIWLDVGEFIANEGSSIHANGGVGRYAGAGGGGRVAIYYESMEGLNIENVTANGGIHYSGAPGEAGSVYIVEKATPPRVRLVSAEGYRDEEISQTTVQFNIGIDPISVDANDFELVDILGRLIAIEKVAAIDNFRYQVDFSEPLTEGTYTFSVGPDIFGTNGLGMDQDQDG